MGGDKKATTMVLKVDLQCSKCYRKIKRVLCQLPQIHDQVFDEKANTVTVKVVCCSPDYVKKKIISKAGDTLKSINIKVDHVDILPKPTKQNPDNWLEGRGPPPPPPEEPQKPKSSAPPKPKASPSSTTAAGAKATESQEPMKPRGPPPPPPEEPQKPKSVPAPATAPVSMAYVQGFPASGGYHYYSEGVQYDGYYGRPVYDSYGGGRTCHKVNNRCDDYFSEENTGACAIM